MSTNSPVKTVWKLADVCKHLLLKHRKGIKKVLSRQKLRCPWSGFCPGYERVFVLHFLWQQLNGHNEPVSRSVLFSLHGRTSCIAPKDVSDLTLWIDWSGREISKIQGLAFQRKETSESCPGSISPFYLLNSSQSEN